MWLFYFKQLGKILNEVTFNSQLNDKRGQLCEFQKKEKSKQKKLPMQRPALRLKNLKEGQCCWITEVIQNSGSK